MIINGTTYNDKTAPEIVDIIERARAARTRLAIFYGDTETGKAWGDVEFGRIGRSNGVVKIPLVVHNARSSGGGALLDSCIVKIETTKAPRRVLYQHPQFHTVDVDNEVPANYPVKVLVPGTAEYLNARELAHCGTCGRSWDDAVVTSITPAPSGRCPFEHFHPAEEPATLSARDVETRMNAINDRVALLLGEFCNLEDCMCEELEGEKCLLCRAQDALTDRAEFVQ